MFRSGVTYRRGTAMSSTSVPAMRLTPPITIPQVLQVIKNATRWAYNPAKPWVGIHPSPNVPADKAPNPLTIKGPRLHADGEEGFR